MAELPEPRQPTVDAIWKARENENNARPQYEGYGVSASRLGTECDRKLFCDLRWVSPPESLTGRKLRIFERGNIEEERVLDDLRRAGLEVSDVDPVTEKQWRFSLANGWLRGKADGRVLGLLEAPKTEHLIEIKSMKAADWRAVQKHGLKKKKPDHWHQLHSGMSALGLNRGAYIAVNKDTEEILIERIKRDAEEANKQEARVLGLVEAHDLPGKIADKAENFACRFCQHKPFCHQQKFARRTCRSCIHFSFLSDGNGHCERFNEPLTPKQQRQGQDCLAHLYLPALVHGDQVDAEPERETITYEMKDGTTWTDGARDND